MTSTSALSQKILNFWFKGHYGNPNILSQSSILMKYWYGSTPEEDLEIKTNFEEFLINYKEYEKEMTKTSDGTLALIIMLDQFPRNIYRKSPLAFSYDHKALELTVNAIQQGYDKQIHPFPRSFMYLPLEHSESIEMQELSLVKFQELKDDLFQIDSTSTLGNVYLQYADKHADIIKQFGRFPHRNMILNRESTPVEIQFLQANGGSMFGQ